MTYATILATIMHQLWDSLKLSLEKMKHSKVHNGNQAEFTEQRNSRPKG